ncbi:MAG TPA: nickel pincer cofactor biosynthesis protein LarB [Candidatus Blautia avistercoris]|uniref:nickel pincer cofactor biosynthesis protein LarB n=1 Tax=Blautia sp. An249 TaxID=1965603 RepID=UPI000B3732A5|nr:nickel pincer cofactor biosynthesis protein LarB [Blautia sp. An249]OUO80168.1 1-(5-phosphoribosyl)-5-amino-4-imidazole-carboxylate carboxylase [Blautia sp. An249]HIY18230.1 nickel pincer cofactor biosynthesis protein LarB [Candidatus Blautia avistercoris]
MKKRELYEILNEVKEGKLPVNEAVFELKKMPFEDLGYAKIDYHRELRQGYGEVIFGQGKTAEQIIGILTSMKAAGQNTILITRLYQEAAEKIKEKFDLYYDPDSHIGFSGEKPAPDGKGTILIMTGGTSDIPVAEEAAWTAEVMGNRVQRVYDVGVAGIHRTLAHMEDIMKANVIIAIAGMEGALASVIAGLADCPVIAVPTSIGYGTSFHGLAALLSMLNSCANGVATVNIDNGFGAGCFASMINHR